MAELVYNVRDIFEKCMKDYSSEKFHIAAYQRGYKWSTSTDGQVRILLSDLTEAFDKNPNKDYYLQYITIKRNSRNISANSSNYLEVIDGQQRLTTLSILFEIINTINPELENITLGKLEYAIRGDLFIERVNNKGKDYWQNEKLLIEINEQDTYYLLSAGFFFYRELINLKDIKPFYNYLCSHVMIIVNSVEPHINSEKVFKNLNSNKVALTDSELVKGLLLTKSVRENPKEDRNFYFTEILEQRANIGRQWDNIVNWVSHDNIKKFYFDSFKEKEFIELLEKDFFKDSSNKDEISITTSILLLLCSFTIIKDPEVKNNKYHLFNFFLRITKSRETNAAYLLQRIQDIYLILTDWHQSNEIFNLFGYQFFHKGSGYIDFKKKMEFISNQLDKDKPSLRSDLHAEKIKVLDQIKVESLQKANDVELHKVFLALNVFDYVSLNEDRKQIIKSKINRFDFVIFSNESWDVEHIFPSNPEDFPDNLEIDDVELVKNIYNGNKDKLSFEQFIDSIENEEIFIGELKRLELLLDKKEKISLSYLQKILINKVTSLADIKDTVGNLCLLTAHVNRSIKRGMFNAKRKAIIQKIAEGHFVPIHTFKVFSKLVSQSMDDTLKVWNRIDIKAHQEAILDKISAIKIDK